MERWWSLSDVNVGLQSRIVSYIYMYICIHILFIYTYDIYLCHKPSNSSIGKFAAPAYGKHQQFLILEVAVRCHQTWLGNPRHLAVYSWEKRVSMGNVPLPCVLHIGYTLGASPPFSNTAYHLTG